jgi:branched-chain amino acid transport system substrate-binding protein
MPPRSPTPRSILYQNDDFGKDYRNGVREILKDRYDHQVTSASYEVTDATIDSQLVTLQAAEIDVLMPSPHPNSPPNPSAKSPG